MKEILHEGRFVRLVREDGWEYVERPDASGIIIIVPVTDDGRIVLVEQFRRAVGTAVIELPAGLAGDVAGAMNESLVAAARRELIEETGYAAGDFVFLTDGPPSPGITSEVITFFRAKGLERVAAGGGDDSEQITVHEVPLEQVDGWLEARRREGIAIDPKVYAGLYFVRRSGDACE